MGLSRSVRWLPGMRGISWIRGRSRPVLGGWYHALETGGIAAEAIVRTEGAGAIMQVEVVVAGGATQSLGACRAWVGAGVT
jgi:hypothetical protein